MWPPDVSIALPEKPERTPKAPVPDGAHGEEVPAQLLPQIVPTGHPTQTPYTARLAGTIPRPRCPTEVSRHRIKLKCFQF